jgi:protein-S-isoprenylcysteine O-methyltransferase Ste14
MFLFWRPIPATVWSVENPLAIAIIWAIFALGWLIVLSSTFLINHFELFGLKQVYQNLRGAEPVAPRFRQPLFYRLVRHPLYAGFIIAFWAIPEMTAGHLLFAIGMTIYILIAIPYEERDLVGALGGDYESYRGRVGMLFPRLRRG